jgi:hypothetical protein
MTDLATCEWAPGSNRFTGPVVQAIAKFKLPPEQARVLTEKMGAHRFDDVVTIRKASIDSKTDAHLYAPGITNMNFGATGRRCAKITRTTWKPDHREEALVYIVGDRAFGFAAVCGNVFELLRLPSKRADTPVAAPSQPDAPSFESRATPIGAVPLQPEVAASPAAAPVATEAAPGGTYPSFGGGGGGRPGLVYVPVYVQPAPPISVPPITAVPEPSTWALLLAGFGALALLKLTKEVAPA